MSRTSTLLGGALLVLLILLAAFIQVKLVPVFVAIMEGLGVAFSAPARLSMGLASLGYVLVPLLLVAVAVGFRALPEERRSAVLSGASFLVAAFLVLQSAIFVDLAIQLPAHLRAARASAHP